MKADKKKTPPIYRVYIRVKIGNDVQIYGFHVQYGQMQSATMNVEGNPETKYYDFEIIETPSNKK